MRTQGMFHLLSCALTEADSVGNGCAALSGTQRTAGGTNGRAGTNITRWEVAARIRISASRRMEQPATPSRSFHVPANSPRAAVAENTRLESIFSWAGVKDCVMVAIATICARAAPEIPCDAASRCAKTCADRSTMTPTTETHETASTVTTDSVLSSRAASPHHRESRDWETSQETSEIH